MRQPRIHWGHDLDFLGSRDVIGHVTIRLHMWEPRIRKLRKGNNIDNWNEKKKKNGSSVWSSRPAVLVVVAKRYDAWSRGRLGWQRAALAGDRLVYNSYRWVFPSGRDCSSRRLGARRLTAASQPVGLTRHQCLRTTSRRSVWAPTIYIKSINQSKFNSGWLAHKEKSHTSTKKRKKREKLNYKTLQLHYQWTTMSTDSYAHLYRSATSS